MTVTLADLTRRTGLDVLDHLERDAAVPVLGGLQAQGDLIVVPLHVIQHAVVFHGGGPKWADVPAEGVEVLRGAAGGNPHTLVADPGVCQWTPWIRDSMRLALGALRTTGPAYLLHPEHGGSGIAPGTYVIRRQREHGGNRLDRLVAD
ncbi:hypothetical protein [Actinomadura hibisca]|uniref:hypothetical protein n=1 Tax=Actinomadura hibisca TaxID=68565 RepID=UPI000ADBE2DC|nr:hypothetical protein [Actinomadura hibisca]